MSIEVIDLVTKRDVVKEEKYMNRFLDALVLGFGGGIGLSIASVILHKLFGVGIC